MKKRRKIAIGIAVGVAVVSKVGLHIWAVNHVPYTYRMSGLKNLTDYILLSVVPMSKDSRMKLRNILKPELV